MEVKEFISIINELGFEYVVDGSDVCKTYRMVLYSSTRIVYQLT